MNRPILVVLLILAGIHPAGSAQMLQHKSAPAQTECQWLHGLSTSYENNHLWQQCYDTTKKFVETCPFDMPNASFAFSTMDAAVSELAGPNGPLRAAYLEWLKSVLYLNTIDPGYFCECVRSIGGALPIPNDTTAGAVSRETNIGLSVIQWLIVNTSCDSPFLSHLYDQSRRTQREQWLNDTNAYKLDTTLPTMHDLGLDTLLARHFQISVGHLPPDRFNDIVSEFRVTKNPFDDQTALRYTLNEMAYVSVTVSDVTGRTVYGDGSGRTMSPGEQQLDLDLHNYPAGTYYLRIALGTGEVRTIKLVKE